jgi:hypothetical protein
MPAEQGKEAVLVRNSTSELSCVCSRELSKSIPSIVLLLVLALGELSRTAFNRLVVLHLPREELQFP